ncbi:DNA polymerase III subunit epsilon [Acidocella sp.]|uniref:DNA polymerase III subunit epsilon n=1 Tax=Acidocella sp. TaxID=50710 RepID=UPI0018141A14|nr:DNA polymerase III subunit epsilon [Acidocella sp.]NNM56270.1 DNA polymerase III subunit epsilon [Acidocella sp.]
MSRSVLFDTETTGFEPLTGDRVIEIAAIELINDLPTGEQFHALLDPERDIPTESTRVHGITNAHVEGKPKFAEVAEAMLVFFGDSPLVAHNAPFDFAFIDFELTRIGRPKLERTRMVDTLVMAKARFPGMPNSLDALCRRFGIDLSARTTHNALLDCKLLADVYVELTGGRQRGLTLETEQVLSFAQYERTGPRTPRPIILDDDSLAAHAAFVAKLKDPIWNQ